MRYYVKSRVPLGDRCIKRSGKIEKAVFHLFVRKSERVYAEAFIKFLDSQVTALINHGDGIVYIRPIVTERCGRDFDTIEFP